MEDIPHAFTIRLRDGTHQVDVNVTPGASTYRMDLAAGTVQQE